MIRVIITTDVFKWVEQIYSLPFFLRDVLLNEEREMTIHYAYTHTNTKDVFWGLWTGIQYHNDLGIVEMLFIHGLIRRSDGKSDSPINLPKFCKLHS